jgi:hypothetical protein
MCESVEILNSDQAIEEFVRYLGSNDFEGALGVAQILWILCPSESVFKQYVRAMLGELSFCHPMSPHDGVQLLGCELLALEYDHSRELLALAA